METSDEEKYEEGAAMWEAIKPFCESVNIHEGLSVFLSGFEKLPVEVGHLLAVHWCDSEVYNGGFNQFFSNSTGILAPEAAKGFRAIGLDECAELVEIAIGKFGELYPRERAVRRAAMEVMRRPGKRREEWDPFNELDDRYYAVKERAGFYERGDAYARGLG